MKRKAGIIYSWFIRSITFFLPDVPVFMRLRGFLYSLFMKRCGPNFQVTATAIINSLDGFRVGRNVYIAQNTVIIGPDISIGDAVIIGPNCVVSGGNHVFADRSYRFARAVAEPVIIENGCWVGANCTILAGTVLPPQSVLGAGSVLNEKFQQPRCLYAGVPARLVKQL